VGADDPETYRELRWYWFQHDFPRLSLSERLRLERQNQTVLRRHLDEYEPDVVAWWAMGGMSMALIESVRRREMPAVGFVHDEWLVYGPLVDGWQRAVRRLGAGGPLSRELGVPAPVRLDLAADWVFVSEAMKLHAISELGPLPNAGVAHSGIDGSLFREAPGHRWRGRLLCAGRIDERKGIDLALPLSACYQA